MLEVFITNAVGKKIKVLQVRKETIPSSFADNMVYVEYPQKLTKKPGDNKQLYKQDKCLT